MPYASGILKYILYIPQNIFYLPKIFSHITLNHYVLTLIYYGASLNMYSFDTISMLAIRNCYKDFSSILKDRKIIL